MNNFDKFNYGLNGFYWFFGIVEDRNDPLNSGRVRVRCFGWHKEDITQIPVSDLPWALVITPINSASVSGIGISPTGMVEGTQVFGFFIDGTDAQMPVIIGTVPGIPASPANPQIGFNDPRTSLDGFPKYPLGDVARNFPTVSDEPDVNRLARNEMIDGTINSLRTPVDTITTASGGFRAEPDNPYSAKYPFNHVTQTESGHTVEFDDTAGAERIHVFHRTGTRVEIHPDGSLVAHCKNNEYKIVDGDCVEHVRGMKDIVVDGNATIKVNDMIMQVTNGNYTLSIDSGNATLNIAGNMTVNVQGDVVENITGSLIQNVSGGVTYNTPTINTNGSIAAALDVTAGPISLITHAHVGVRSGGDVSGPPI